jgi:CRP-like cAMP-binding protein
LRGSSRSFTQLCCEENVNRITPDTLRTFPLLKELGDPALAAIAADCVLQHYSEGELVIGHTDTSFDVLLVVAGAVRVSLYSADGQRVGFLDLPKGMMLGEIAAIDGLPRSASVEAIEASIIAKLPRKRFLTLMEEHPRFALAVARQLAGHVRRLTTRVFEFSTMAVRQRLRAELLRLAAPGPGDSAAIAHLPTHAELASRISTHREAVSREMAWLDGHGYTEKQGRSLTIPSLSRFRGLLENGWDG